MSTETDAKYHHLIPQTYMSAWEKCNGTLKVEYLNNPGVVYDRNKKKIAGITNYHSITAGMPICTLNDTDTIFASLKPYNVEYQSKTITNTLDMNKIFFDFENWIITRSDGSLVSKKQILNDILEVKIRDIETNWNIQYENNWATQVATIEKNILSATTTDIPAFDREFLMKFFTALDWRGFKSNYSFEEVTKQVCNDIIPLGEIDIPNEERTLSSLKTAEEEVRHCLLLKYYRQFLNNTGIIYRNAIENLKHTTFHFLIADGPSYFITSDTPAFVYERTDSFFVGLLPITPRILLAQCRQSGNYNYHITHITEEAVKRYNTIIRENAEEFVILNW